MAAESAENTERKRQELSHGDTEITEKKVVRLGGRFGLCSLAEDNRTLSFFMLRLRTSEEVPSAFLCVLCGSSHEKD